MRGAGLLAATLIITGCAGLTEGPERSPSATPPVVVTSHPVSPQPQVPPASSTATSVSGPPPMSASPSQGGVPSEAGSPGGAPPRPPASTPGGSASAPRQPAPSRSVHRTSLTVGSDAAFVTPDAAVVCLLRPSAGAVVCQRVDGSPIVAMRPCLTGYGGQIGRHIQLSAGVSAPCMRRSVRTDAVAGAAPTGWVTQLGAWATRGSVRYAALPAGRTLTAGALRCATTASSVTCRNTSTGRWLTLTPTTYRTG